VLKGAAAELAEALPGHLCVKVKVEVKVNFEIYLADRKATARI